MSGTHSVILVSRVGDITKTVASPIEETRLIDMERKMSITEYEYEPVVTDITDDTPDLVQIEDEIVLSDMKEKMTYYTER